ncbi:MAG: hypothetical protein IJO51_07900 [Clostridia bacterium]|nr:hypothetical protein [Clostridia bacterium]MBQ9925926.1 hypothetical protein [Clostridia bacterium]
MAKPPIGAKLKTRDFHNVTIKKQLGAGGQGTVYLVDYDGKEKALKWYHNSIFTTQEKMNRFYDNLCTNIENGPPSEDFLWPQDVTEKKNGSFGYIMDLRPQRFQELSVLLVGRKAKFKSFQVRIDGMLNMVNAFRLLHNKGYSYQDLNDGNFFFDPDTGECLICDNDNALYQGSYSGILGKQRYMAPEVVLGQRMPDKPTDRFSMAVILFLMLMHLHPLEGVYSTPPCMTPEYERKFYGQEPVFVFDPEDRRNRPIRGIGDHAIAIWNELPDYLQDAFIRSFSKGAMTYTDGKYGKPRLIEREWLDVLTRFRNTIYSCPHCPNEEFIKELPAHCSACNASLPVSHHLKGKKYNMPLFPGVRLLRFQTGECADKDALDVIFEIRSTPDGRYYAANQSKEIWRCTNTKGMQIKVAPGEIMPVIPGVKAKINGTEFEII